MTLFVADRNGNIQDIKTMRGEVIRINDIFENKANPQVNWNWWIFNIPQCFAFKISKFNLARHTFICSLPHCPCVLPPLCTHYLHIHHLILRYRIERSLLSWARGACRCCGKAGTRFLRIEDQGKQKLVLQGREPGTAMGCWSPDMVHTELVSF